MRSVLSPYQKGTAEAGNHIIKRKVAERERRREGERERELERERVNRRRKHVKCERVGALRTMYLTEQHTSSTNYTL